MNDVAWEAAKAEGKAVLARCARSRELIAYSELIKHVHAVKFTDGHDPRLRLFLKEISMEENAAGRGLLTALVVHKYGEHKPGPGFFELAEKLGRYTKDIDRCWIDELKTVYAAWERTNPE